MLRLKMNAKNKKAKMCKGKIITMDERKMYEGRDEIDLVALMLSVAHKYCQIIAAALIGALLLGGGSALKNAVNQRQAQSAASQTEESEYDEAASQDEYRLQQIQADQKRVERDIQNLNEYAENSILMNLDSSSVCSADAVLAVSNDYKIIPEMGFQDSDDMTPLLNSYVAILTGHDTLSGIAAEVGMEERYLEELVEVSADAKAHLLSIHVISDRAERSETILEALLECRKNAQGTVEQAVGRHEVRELSRNSGVVALDALRETQSNFRVSLTKLEKEKTDLQSSYETAARSLQNHTSGWGSVIKYAVLGAILGIVVVMGCATVRFISGGKASSAGELCRYSGVPVLGRLAGEATQKQKGLDAWLNKLERRPNGGENEETIRLIAALVRNLEPDAETVLLTGDLPAEQMQALCGKLQAAPGMNGKKVTASACVLSSAQAVEQVVASDVVLLVADCARTRIVDFQMQSDRIQKLGKKVLGCVVFE